MSDQPQHLEEHVHHHVLPLKAYLGIYGMLLFLTGITVAVSVANLGKYAIIVALVVAVIKARLVVEYFMHLKFDGRLLRFLFAATIFFVVLFIGVTLAELSTRGDVVDAHENVRGNIVLEQGKFKRVVEPGK